MALVVWVMMGIALWHFTVFLPDRFWGGIVGAFLASFVAAALFGFIANGLTVPGKEDTELIQAFVAIPGAIIGLTPPTSGAPHGPRVSASTTVTRARARTSQTCSPASTRRWRSLVSSPGSIPSVG